MRIRLQKLCVAFAAAVVVALSSAAPTGAESYRDISGSGSSWAAGAIEAMAVNVKQFGMTVNYAATGSSAGRSDWLKDQVDFAASDIPFQFEPEDGSAPERPPAGSYEYIPVTAGGTSFMYNLKINGRRVTNLRLSGENVAKIFTATIRKWNDPALAADNPGLTLPDRQIVPVVRSDGSGSSNQFTRWLIHQHAGLWQDYCERSKRAPACGATSFYPTVSGMIAQSGDQGVAGYLQNNLADGAIGYVNYSYALGAEFPVAKVLNAAGYYTEPTPEKVAVSLLKARINTNEGSPDYLTQVLDDVYTDSDPRSYQLSSYSYFILRTKTTARFGEEQGKTLGRFTSYAMCEAQQQSASLGYSPLPINLVEASLQQIAKIPGAAPADIDIKRCKNPTFSDDGTNVLARDAKQPEECDKKGPSQCATGTAGARGISTPVKAAASGGAAGGSGGGTGGSAGRTSSTGSRSSSGTGASSTGTGGSVLAADGSVADGLDATDDGGVDEIEAVASPTVLAGSSGWSGSQTLIVLITLFTLALILGPPFMWRFLANRRGGLS